MSKEESALRSEREGKRAQFVEDEAGGAGKKNTVKVLALVALALAGLAVYFVAAGGGGRAAGVAAGGGGALKAEGGQVSIPVSELDAKARFYEYKTASGKTVSFFAMRSSDGVYRAALNACDVCFAGKQGYRQEGDDMVCNKCGNHFHSAQINEVKGGCNPVGLQRKVEGDRVLIDARGLEAGAGYF
ncbi:MAG TPA: DUF2318 domain-containing protein [Pyrinomonadaceae bacterium]|jgi:hypothetical protein